MNNNSPPSLAPIQGQGRIAALDIIRGVAVLGILLINILWFGLPKPLQSAADPTVYGGAEGANLWVWMINAMWVEGTQRGLFTLLFGAGVILFTERLESSQRPYATDLYFRRYLWLLGFGLVHGFVLLWAGDVLFVYGVLALFVYAFRRASSRTLLFIALGGFALNAAWTQLDLHHAMKTHDAWQAAVSAQQAGHTLTSEQTEAIERWQARIKESKPDAKTLQQDIDAHRGSYFAQFAFQAPFRSFFQSLMIYRAFFDFFSMMLVGMALFKSGLLRTGQPSRIYWRMVLIGYGVGLTVNFFEVRHVLVNEFSVLSQLQVGVSTDVGRLAMTVGHVGVLMLWCNASFLGGLKRRLAAVGQMALTSYVSHAILCAFVFYGIGFGLFGQLQRYQLYYVVFSIWAFQLLVSPIWLTHYRFGPLEWLWRSLTYGQRQPMRRRGPVGSVVAEST